MFIFLIVSSFEEWVYAFLTLRMSTMTPFDPINTNNLNNRRSLRQKQPEQALCRWLHEISVFHRSKWTSKQKHTERGRLASHQKTNPLSDRLSTQTDYQHKKNTTNLKWKDTEDTNHLLVFFHPFVLTSCIVSLLFENSVWDFTAVHEPVWWKSDVNAIPQGGRLMQADKEQRSQGDTTKPP